MRRLPKLASDVPEHISSAARGTCSACLEANSVHLRHPGTSYAPSYPGRLLHSDIAGPFVTSAHGHTPSTSWS